MTHTQYLSNARVVIDGIYHSIITRTKPPKIGGILEFLAAGWARVLCQGLDLPENTLEKPIGQGLQLFAGRRLEKDGEPSHESAGV